MNNRIVAAPRDGAQPIVGRHETADANRLSDLEALPHQWRQGLLCINKNKKPIDRHGRLLVDWYTSPVPSWSQLLKAPAVGLRTGRLTSTLCFDFDGIEAWATFAELFGGPPAAVLPKTIGWKSGKPHRCQLAFAIAEEDQWLLRGRRRKVGSLELRWEGQQSVLMGHHPETGFYKWIESQSPAEQSLASLPPTLIKLIPEQEGAAALRPQVAGQVEPSPHVTGLVVPLEQFISYRSRVLIENGSSAGHCNDDSMRLSLDLVAAEAWLKVQGVGVERTAWELFSDYCCRCPETINGRPFDWQAMRVRFEGAVKRNPVPPTPEHKLLERLAYHRRATRRTTNHHHVGAGVAA